MELPDALDVVMSREDAPVDRDPIVGRMIGEVLPRRWATDLAPLVASFRPDLIIRDAGTLGAGLAGRVAGIPVLCHGFGRVSADPIGESMVAAFTACAAEFDVPGLDLLTGEPFIDICPESVQAKDFLARDGRIPLRPVAWSEPGPLPDWLHGRNRSRPLVYVTLGTAYAAGGLLRAAVLGIATLPVDVVVATGPAVTPAELGDLPDSVRVSPWLPQAQLWPHVDLVVHHGGSGTMLGAFAAGVPQLVLPQGVDQFANAEAVVAAGTGTRLLGEDADRDAITDRVRALLVDEDARTAARRLAAEIAAMPSPADLAARLPDLDH